MSKTEIDNLKNLVKEAYAYYRAVQWSPDWGDIIDFVAGKKAELGNVDRSTIDLDQLNLEMQDALGCQDQEGEVDE